MTELRVVTVICTGNICRSPMAKVLLEKHLAERGVVDVDVRSAGTHASTGQPAMRAAVAAGTEAGKAAKAVMEAGGLVSDEIVIAILRDRMAEEDCARGVILDGFPRTTVQAEALDGLAGSVGVRLTSRFGEKGILVVERVS